MKGKDLKTLETFIAEYGPKPGAPTSVGSQVTGGITNKSNSGGVANNPIKTALGAAPAKPPVAAKKVKPGTVVNNPDDGKEVEIVAPVGVPSNPDTVVVKDTNGEYVTIDPDTELEVKETKSERMDKLIKRKNKLRHKIKRVLRAQKQAQSDSPRPTDDAFASFEQLPLAEQLTFLEKVDHNIINEALLKKQKATETIEAGQDTAALLTAYGSPTKKKKKKNKEAKGFEHPNKSGNGVKEGAVPVHNVKRDFNDIMNKPLLGSDLKSQMQAYFVVPDPSMVREFRSQIALAGKNVDLRPVFKAFADSKLHPKHKNQIAESVLTESRGVTARQPGEQYISDTDPKDILTIQSIDVFPSDGQPAYDTVEDLQSVLDQAVPDQGMRIDDNNPTGGSKAAIVATVTNEKGEDQYWVRFIKAIPDSGVDKLWKTIRGYKYSKGASRESIPVKPSDMVTPNTYISTEQVAADVNANATKMFAGTEHSALIDVLNDAVKKARADDVSPIAGASPYFNVIQKYAGEYLGPLALIDGGNLKGDTKKMLEAYGLTSLAGSTIMFPDDTSYPLVDSLIRTPDGKEIGISSKAHTGGGAPSSLSGVVDQLTPEIESRYPRGTAIMKLLGTTPIKLGPVLAAKEMGLLNDQDVEDFKQVSLASRELSDITNEKLRNIAANQGVKDEAHPNYRVFFRLLAGVVNQIIPMINNDQEFINAMKETLNNNNFIQVLQKGKKVGDGVTMDYYSKYPAVFEGAPKLVNKGYAATMAKDRLGFKLKK